MVPELDRRQGYGCKRSPFLRSESSTREPFARKLQKTRFRVKEEFAEIKGGKMPPRCDRCPHSPIPDEFGRISWGHNLAGRWHRGNRLCVDGRKCFPGGRKRLRFVRSASRKAMAMDEVGRRGSGSG